MLVKEEEEDLDQDERISVDMAEEEPVVRFVNSLLAQALADNASDIHVEPLKNYMRVRMRVDGKLREVPSPEKKMLLPIVSRIKILAGLISPRQGLPRMEDSIFVMRTGKWGSEFRRFRPYTGKKLCFVFSIKSTASMALITRLAS